MQRFLFSRSLLPHTKASQRAARLRPLSLAGAPAGSSAPAPAARTADRTTDAPATAVAALAPAAALLAALLPLCLSGCGTGIAPATTTAAAVPSSPAQGSQIAFDPVPDHRFGDAPFSVAAHSVSGAPILYSVLTGPAQLQGNTVTLTGAGGVTLQATQPATATVAAGSTTLTFAVDKAVSSLTLRPIPAHAVGDAPFPIQADATTPCSGLISYAVLAGPATLRGNLLTLTGHGAITLQAIQNADSNYTGSTTTASFTVIPAAAAAADVANTLAFAPIAAHTFGDAPFLVAVNSPSAGALTYSVVSGPATVTGNTVALTGAGTVVVQATQAADAKYPAASVRTAFSVAKAMPTFAFAALPSVIDGDPPFTVSATSASTGAVTYTVVSGPAVVTRDQVRVTGPGAITLRATQAASTDFAAAVAQGTLTAAVANTSPVGLVKHIVVLFDENVSFDHYFGSYPRVANGVGEPVFTALPDTPSVDGYTDDLLYSNPNRTNPANGAGAHNPFRLARVNAATADQQHSYLYEQIAFHGGTMDLFPLSVGAADGPALQPTDALATTGLTMGFFDGNTVTALWNYAQHFSMSDHFFGTTFGPSTLGAINLISGQTNGAVNDSNAAGALVGDGSGGLTLIGDANPSFDICSASSAAMTHLTGKNVGDLLNGRQVSWGFFQEGFDLTLVNPNGSTGCQRTTRGNVTGSTARDYIPHHQPFQYYASTSNPRHTRPKSVGTIGAAADTAANHQYDLHDFYDALKAGNFPAVSFLKAAGYRDGHAGYSDPLSEQRFLVEAINAIQQSPEWPSTVILITYDDSDGWYDHAHQIVNHSKTTSDGFTSPGNCGDGTAVLPGVAPGTQHAQGRCGYGPRLPLLAVSPWAHANAVDSTVTDQTSVLRLIEDTFLDGERIGQGSFDAVSGPLNGLFDFRRPQPQNSHVLLLDAEHGTVTNSY